MCRRDPFDPGLHPDHHSSIEYFVPLGDLLWDDFEYPNWTFGDSCEKTRSTGIPLKEAPELLLDTGRRVMTCR